MAIFDLSFDELREELKTYKDKNIQPADPYMKFLYLVYAKNTTRSMAISRVLMEDFSGQSYKAQDLFSQVCTQQARDIDFKITEKIRIKREEQEREERGKNNNG